MRLSVAPPAPFNGCVASSVAAGCSPRSAPDILQLSQGRRRASFHGASFVAPLSISCNRRRISPAPSFLGLLIYFVVQAIQQWSDSCGSLDWQRERFFPNLRSAAWLSHGCTEVPYCR